MATTSKLSFRARNLDASKFMPIYIADELPDLSECTPINRAVAQMPTGMEKDEEMELHLQEAIIAQQASTSGISVENHVIPTPKVHLIEKNKFNSYYPTQPAPSKNQLIKVQASLSVDREQPEYDVDSEDEEWLAERGQISESDFEKMMELLEGASSDMQICQPKEARSLLRHFDDDLVDDVYDYWLQKRKDAAASRKAASLIPRVRTENRRDNTGAINPYIAFRRRAEKMQTRKNRKNDEDSYEKTLKLHHDFSRAVMLFDMLSRREKSKGALIELEESIFDERWTRGISSSVYNHIVAKWKPELHAVHSQADDTQDDLTVVSLNRSKSHKRKKLGRCAVVSAMDKGVVSRAWLKKNAEAWNRPPTGISSVGTTCSPSTSSIAEAERTAAAADAAADGRYAFKRRRGCVYRDNIFYRRSSGEPSLDGFGFDFRLARPSSPLRSVAGRSSTDSGPTSLTRDLTRSFYRTFLPSSAAKGVRRCIGYARRRIGRGGRVIFDRLLFSPPSTSQCVPQELRDADCVNTTRSYQSKCTFADDESNWDNWSADSDEERAEKERYECEYERREELFRTRIYENPSDSRFSINTNNSGSKNSCMDATASQTVWKNQGTTPYLSSNGTTFPSTSFKVQSTLMNGFRSEDIPNSSAPRGTVMEPSGVMFRTHLTAPDNNYAQMVPSVSAPNGISSTNGNLIAVSMASVTSNAFQQQDKRVTDTCVRVQPTVTPSIPQSQLSRTSEDSRSIFYPLLPPPVSVAGLEEAGVQVHNEDANSSPLEGTFKRRLPSSERRQGSQSTVSGDRSSFTRSTDSRPRMNGVKRSKGSASPTIAQRASAIVAEASLKRFGSVGRLNGEPNQVLTKCVDTKRLELAIAGSGARIKAPVVSSALTSAAVTLGSGTDLHPPLIDVLKGSPTKNVNGASIGTFSTCTYSAPQFTTIIADSHMSPQQTSIVNSYYAASDNMGGLTSSPDSESMSPPMSTSPAVVPELSRHFSIGTTQIDSRHGVMCSKSWIGTESKVRKRSFEDFSQVRDEDIRTPLHAALMSGPLAATSLRTTSVSSPMSPQPIDYSHTLIANGGDAPACDATPNSNSIMSYYNASSFSTHNKDISLSEGPMVG